MRNALKRSESYSKLPDGLRVQKKIQMDSRGPGGPWSSLSSQRQPEDLTQGDRWAENHNRHLAVLAKAKNSQGGTK